MAQPSSEYSGLITPAFSSTANRNPAIQHGTRLNHFTHIRAALRFFRCFSFFPASAIVISSFLVFSTKASYLHIFQSISSLTHTRDCFYCNGGRTLTSSIHHHLSCNYLFLDFFLLFSVPFKTLLFFSLNWQLPVSFSVQIIDCIVSYRDISIQ